VQKNRLGNTDMQITRLGVGAWAIGGGGWAYGWGPQNDQDSIASIYRALDAGINWIDTAALYGLGHSEEVIGRALHGRGGRPYVFTKCGWTWGTDRALFKSLKADSIRREAEASLRRLQVEAIDLFQIHWPDPNRDLEEAWTMLAALKAEGKVRHIGACNFSVTQIERAQKIAPVATLQCPYSILAREIERSVLPFAAANNIGVIVYSPMKSGLLSGAMTRERIANFPHDDFRRTASQFNEPLLSRNLKLVDLLRFLGQKHGRSPGEVAIAWALNNQQVTGAIVGVRSARQVEGVLGAADLQLSQQELSEIDRFLRDTDNWKLRARALVKRARAAFR